MSIDKRYGVRGWVVGLLSAAALSVAGATLCEAAGSAPKTAVAAHPTSITLSWYAPTENTNNSALTNLSGYAIYYGTTAKTMTNKISLSGVGVQTYVITNLTPGLWFFTVVALNSAGVHSGTSTIVHTTL